MMKAYNKGIKDILPRGLIVSCQALDDEPLHDAYIMGRMAYAASLGGAIGIRANGASDIKEIKKMVSLPVIGIKKAVYEGSSVYITPTWAEVDELVHSGAEIIALDATDRSRPDGLGLEEFVQRIRREHPGLFIMADVATFEEAENANRLGFDLISSTLSGYTENTRERTLPDIDLVSKMSKSLSATIIAEGGIWTLEHIDGVMEAGAYAVVIGTAITRPAEITRRFWTRLNSYL